MICYEDLTGLSSPSESILSYEVDSIMIVRRHRFHGYNALRHVYSRGQTVRSSLFAVKYIDNQRRSEYRAAVVVSRKVHKSAVVRGRIRRRIYEIIRLHQQSINRPYDIVITAFSDQLATISAVELQKSILATLIKQQIMSSTSQPPLEKTQGHAIVDAKERR